MPEASRGTGHGVAFDQDETKDRPRRWGLRLDICSIVSFRSLDCVVYRWAQPRSRRRTVRFRLSMDLCSTEVCWLRFILRAWVIALFKLVHCRTRRWLAFSFRGAYVPAVSRAYLSRKLTRPLPTKDGGTLRTVLAMEGYHARFATLPR